MVEHDLFASRLDKIETRWSLIRGGTNQTAAVADARRVLVLRYSSAIRRYSGAILKDDDAADELAQEVVIRLLRGDFGNADPDRGRFRDLLKAAIRNMARNQWARNNRRRGEAADIEQLVGDEPDEKDAWTEAWRQNVLDLAWSALAEYERSHQGSIACTVLRLRADYPDEDSEKFAARLSDKIGRTVRADTARQQLHRARRRFAEYLVQEVTDGLDSPSAERVQDELIALGLYEHVREFARQE